MYKVNDYCLACETFILVQKLHVALEGGWNKNDDGIMILIDLMNKKSFNDSWIWKMHLPDQNTTNHVPNLILMSRMSFKCIL